MNKKRIRASAVLPQKRVALAVAAALMPWVWMQPALADPASNQLPTGGQVTAGTANISTAGSKMQIDQSTDKAILNWQTFSIGSSAWVNFSQPSASSIALNRVLGNNPSEIFGRLSANGQVFLSNPSGVLFAPSASVDVGALFATSLSINDQDFLAGRYNFYNAGNAGSVVNQGTIIATNGYAALAGPQVRNDGIIIAQAGTVTLAAGDRVTLDMVGDGLISVSVDAVALNASAINAGTIQADGGRVLLTARSANALLDTVINNSGIIRAKSLAERNGEIVLDGGGAGVVANSGTLDASGAGAGTTGGTVKVSGQYVALTEGSSTDASGDAGGGTVTVSATDAAFVYGSISARDTGGNGKGGTVETSGRYLEVTQAPNVGAGGTWLIDPYNIDVVADVPPPGFSNNTGPTTFTPIGDSSQIAASLITNQLNAGTTVILDTGGFGSPGMQAGDIRVQAGIEKTALNPVSLTLKAFHDVEINQPISIASSVPGPAGFGTLTIDAGNNVVVSAPITTQGGGLNIRAGGFTNHSAINNGVGGDLKPGMAVFADRFDLGDGTINGGQGSVGLFTRTATNSLGVESAGDTTITNADIASITTSPDLPSTNANQLLIGVGSGGAMTIGANAQVIGGGKNLWFTAPGGTGTNITVGANGVSTTGDVRVDAGAGAIRGTGTIGGNHVVLAAGSGIGLDTARVGTAAGTLAARGGNGSVYVSEADDVTLGPVTFAGLTSTNGVGPGGVYDLTANGSVTVSGIVSLGGRLNLGVGGSLNLPAAGLQDALLISSGGQTISAQSLALTARDSRRAILSNNGGNQTLTIGSGGMNLDVLAGAGVAQISNNSGSGTQTIQTSGALSVVGGSALPSFNSGVFQNQSGEQTVTAANVVLQGAMAGNSGAAFISNTGGGGDQEINVAGGTISISGGAVGLANRAGIVTVGNQTINGNPDIILTGGTSGTGTSAANTSNAVFLNSNGVGKLQTIDARTITVSAGSGGNDTFAVISAPNQVITATEDVMLTGGAGTGEGNAARMGGLGGTAGSSTTNLTLNARDVILTGGTTNGAGLGASGLGASQASTITVNATRDVILNSGGGAGARIGTSFNFATPAGGDITVNAGNSIQLNGTTQPTAIRTTGNVTLTANGLGGITEGPNGFVQAGSLTATSKGAETLTGPNAISSLNVPLVLGAPGVAGSFNLNNTGDLTITSLRAGGTVTLTEAGALTLSASGTQDALLTSVGGQTITAQSLSMSAQDGRRAQLFNSGSGNQSITTTVGGIDVVAVGGAGTAQIVNGSFGAGNPGNQTIISNGALNVVGGSATGSGPGFSNSGVFVNATGKQTVTAANITLQGALAGNNGGAFISNTGGGGDQEINVASGTISITGGAVGFGNRAGIVTNGNQTINGNPNIVLTGGTSGTGSAATNTSNGAFISENGTTKQQTINAGNITLTAGSGGTDTFAAISGANQVITATGDVLLTGGAGTGDAAGTRIGGVAGLTSGPTNLMLNARDVILTGGTATGSGAGLGSTIVGIAQPNTITVTATRDVILNSGSGAGARIGTSSNFATPAAGDISISAASIQLNGTGTTPTAIRTTGNVSLTALISEGTNGFVQAGGLNVLSGGTVNLDGPNQISSFGASGLAPAMLTVPIPGSVILNNTGALTITGINANGTLNLTNAGALTIAGGSTQDAVVSSFGGQTINAQSLTVTAQNGHSASLINSGSGNQSISISGGGLGAGIDVQNLGGPVAFINSNAPGGTQTITLSGGDHLAVKGLNGVAAINSNGGAQTISLTGAGANAVAVGAAGAFGTSVISGRGQTLTAGTGIQSGSITITGASGLGTTANIGTQPGSGAVAQTISTTGTLQVTGGNAIGSSNTGVFHNGTGLQSVTAGNIVLQGGTSTGTSGGGAFISNSNGGGDQDIFATGSINLTAGSVGQSNRAFISSNGNQTINGDPSIVITGGAGGGGSAVLNTSNGAGINTNGVGKVQTIHAGSITLNAGSGGNETFAIINGANQVITASGDVLITGGDGTGTVTARIGGIGGGTPGPTNLMLNARDVILTGGSAAGGEAGLGSTVLGTSQPNTITVNAMRDVILNSGTGSGARIGTGQVFATPASGDINVVAGRNIQLNGTAQPAAIRTLGTVTLHADQPGGTISESGNGFVQAGSLITTSNGAMSLVGPNLVSAFNGTTSNGDLTLYNSGDLNLAALIEGFGNLTVVNAGSVNAGVVSSNETMSLNIAGDLNVVASGTEDLFVSAGGQLSLNLTGALNIVGITRNATVASGAGQTINARSLLVSAENGRGASLLNDGSGDQTITITGGGTSAGVDVRNLGGGTINNPAAIVNRTGNQTIAVTDADHISVNGVGATASLFSSGNQSISITGGGHNAINIGSAGALGGSNVNAGLSQTVTAGTAGTIESGSISIVGPAGTSRIAGFVTNAGVGADAQTISTTGTLTVTGGSAPVQTPNFNSGIFHNRQGLQTINAANIVVQGGTGGSNNAAFISTNTASPLGPGGQDQVIDVTGGITITGSDAGTNNRAIIVANNGTQTINAGDITIHAGASGVSGTINAGIVTNTVGQQQTINAHNIALSNPASGGIDSFASIAGTNQLINAAGDVTLTGQGSGGTLAGVRIGGFGGATPTPTNLVLNVGGDLVLTGGTAPNNGAAIGSSAVASQPNSIDIHAGGSVILNSGAGSGARIGSAAAALAGGDISVTAGGNIELNGTAQPTAIRTLGNVTLNAGSISEASNGFIVAGGLNTTSSGNTSLIGPNQVSSFIGSSGTGDVSLTNTSALLTVSSLTARDVVLNQAGDLAVTGNVVASGAGTINATGGITLAADATPIEVRAGGPVSMTVGNDLRLAGGAGAGAHALVFSGSDIFLTIGGAVRLNAGTGSDSWARIQTATRDSVINIYFPNLSSGGYFVNDIEGALRRGQTGFLSGMGVAAPGQEFITTYGLQ